MQISAFQDSPFHIFTHDGAHRFHKTIRREGANEAEREIQRRELVQQKSCHRRGSWGLGNKPEDLGQRSKQNSFSSDRSQVDFSTAPGEDRRSAAFRAGCDPTVSPSTRKFPAGAPHRPTMPTRHCASFNGGTLLLRWRRKIRQRIQTSGLTPCQPTPQCPFLG